MTNDEHQTIQIRYGSHFMFLRRLLIVQMTIWSKRFFSTSPDDSLLSSISWLMNDLMAMTLHDRKILSSSLIVLVLVLLQKSDDADGQRCFLLIPTIIILTILRARVSTKNDLKVFLLLSSNWQRNILYNFLFFRTSLLVEWQKFFTTFADEQRQWIVTIRHLRKSFLC